MSSLLVGISLIGKTTGGGFLSRGGMGLLGGFFASETLGMLGDSWDL